MLEDGGSPADAAGLLSLARAVELVVVQESSLLYQVSYQVTRQVTGDR